METDDAMVKALEDHLSPAAISEGQARRMLVTARNNPTVPVVTTAANRYHIGVIWWPTPGRWEFTWSGR